MGLLSTLLQRAPIKPFAEQLAEEIGKRYPQRIDADAKKRPSVNRLTRIVEDACHKAKDFQQEHKLGWYGRAKLGHSLKWALKDRGYSEDFINLATEAVIVTISKKA